MKKENVTADLHTHSTASDGEFSPSDLVRLAVSRRMKAVSLTDHDTLKGIPGALEEGERLGIRVIPGIEIGAGFEPGKLHILGFFPEYPAEMEKELDVMQQARVVRVPRIIRKLNELGIMLTREDVVETAGDSQIGRPHIARALLKKGFVRTFDEAFDTYLRRGKKAYVPNEKVSWQDALRLIRLHGGLPVLAHPYTLNLSNEGLADLLREMKHAGLAGMEVFYPDHTPEQTAVYERLALRSGLLITGGTDFHGPLRNAVPVGDYGIDEERLEIFLDRLFS
jgi:predicted metal-dependent phosphoesterase TrpH